jgi:hypothetical protein
MEHSRRGDNEREGLVIRWMAWTIAALLKPKALLVAENLGRDLESQPRQLGLDPSLTPDAVLRSHPPDERPHFC